MVDLHLRSGWIPATTNAENFERVIAEVCDPIFNKPLSEISFADFMTQLLRTAADFNMEIQPQLVLLQKPYFISRAWAVSCIRSSIFGKPLNPLCNVGRRATSGRWRC
ncbi:MAG: hypothetical protein CM15mP68_5440 [Pseudomonadota bacterium]|nr:MAG: hypothetical protein CM15mP68_5440 [Pseudomonadota bacterium]